MTQAQELANALNVLAKGPQFSYQQARASARKAGTVDWARTKNANEDFNPDVDGCESFVMLDGSVCEWAGGKRRYNARS
ncbi:MAG: hypothetical protein GIW95_09195 [Candidatus Eremiobacteraeota bacterium]|nr:hypothetical protein [Candidatus Eremiobacteraeota bacterium]